MSAARTCSAFALLACLMGKAAVAQVLPAPVKDQAPLLRSADPKLAANKRLVFDMMRTVLNAGRAGEAEACTTLLRKIRECARYAESHGMGYLEASGIPPLYRREG